MHALAQFPPSYAFHDTLPCVYGRQDDYEIGRKLGYGKYSDVFEGYCPETDSSVVIKILKPVRKKKICREIKILSNLIGGPNCINLLDVVPVHDSDYPALIMEHGGLSLAHSLPQLDSQSIRIILFQTLRALDWLHIHGIIHRDTKPGNITYDLATHKLHLLDYGLAEFYSYGTTLHHRVASRHFKSPELLVGYQLYDYSLDIWSLGAMAAGMIFRRNPFFRGTNNVNQLDKIVEILGSAKLFDLLDKYNIKLPQARAAELRGYEGMSFDVFLNNDNQHLVCEQALDFLKKVLVYDPEERLTVREAMAHPYFDPIREQMADLALKDVRATKKLRDSLLSAQTKELPPHIEGIIGLHPSSLPTWKVADPDKQNFPIPINPSEMSNNPQKYDEFTEEWNDYWITLQRNILKAGMATYGDQIDE